MPPPATDEHSLSAATPIAAGAVWAVALVAAGVVATAAVAHYRVGLTEGKLAATEVRLDAGAATTAEHEARLRVLEALLPRMDSKLDKLLEGGTRTAGGRK
jgi:hypothetical protein